MQKRAIQNLSDDNYLQTVIPSNKKNFQEIIQFYVFECPVEGTSKRAKTFCEQGWRDGYFATLKSHMLKNASPSLKNNYHPCKKDELEHKYNHVMNSVPFGEEYCVFLKHDERKVMHSLYVAIRNSFAHGSFGLKTHNKITAYYLVNFKDYTKAKIVLLEQTLLNWIHIFKSNPNNLRNYNN